MSDDRQRPGWPTYWGVIGFLALLTQAILKLTPLALEALESELSMIQWIALLGYAAFMAYSEGYMGFHRQTAPRVVQRGLYLSANRTWLRVLLAPAFCMGLFGATRKRLIISWVLVVMIVGLVIAVGWLNQPWRGIVDAGVVLGLAIGMTSIVYYLVRAIFGYSPGVDPEVPLSP